MIHARPFVMAVLLATSSRAAAQSHAHNHAHAHGAPSPADRECAVCVPVPGTKKTSKFEYQTSDVTKCYVKVRSDFLRRLRHEPPADPEVVPTRRRVLMKRETTKEEPTVKYEARTFAAPCPVHHLERCRLCAGG